MKKTIITAVALMAAFNAQAKERDVGNGGDACTQTIPTVVQWLGESITAQGEKEYPEFEFAVLKFFIKNAKVSIVPTTVVDGEETDAKNYPEKKIIELNRGRWCALSDAKKTQVIFHEYLGLMGLEGTNEYSISSRMVFIEDARKDEEKKKERNERWYCAVTLYKIDTNYIVYPGNEMTHAPEVYGNYSGYGATPDEAFDKIKGHGDGDGYLTFFCKTIGANPTNGKYFCAEFITAANSCILNKKD